MRSSHLVSAVLLCVAAPVVDAAAQVLQPPPRSVQGLFSGRPSTEADRVGHQLSMTFNLLGGYEDNLSPHGSVPTDPLAPRRSGTNGVLTSQLRYRYGNSVKFVETNARGFVNSFRNIGLRAMYGGEVGAHAATRLGNKANLTASATTEYTPSFTITSAVPSTMVASEAIAPADPTAGISELESTGATATSTLAYDWNSRQHTDVGYAYSRNEVRSTTGLKTTAAVATLRQTWTLSRAVALVGSYQFADQSTAEQSGNSRPVDTHTGQFGLRLTKAVSRTRRLSVTGGAGAIRVETLAALDNSPFQYTAPSLFGGARLDLGRTWAVSADLRRDVTVLEGLSAQSFLTDVATLWLGGNVGQSWTFALNGSYTTGRPHEGETGSFDAASLQVQLQYGLTQWCSLMTSYGHYQHRLRDLSRVPAGFPDQFTRNIVRAGVTFWLPLIGTFGGERRLNSGSN